MVKAANSDGSLFLLMSIRPSKTGTNQYRKENLCRKETAPRLGEAEHGPGGDAPGCLSEP